VRVEVAGQRCRIVGVVIDHELRFAFDAVDRGDMLPLLAEDQLDRDSAFPTFSATA